MEDSAHNTLGANPFLKESLPRPKDNFCNHSGDDFKVCPGFTSDIVDSRWSMDISQLTLNEDIMDRFSPITTPPPLSLPSPIDRSPATEPLTSRHGLHTPPSVFVYPSTDCRVNAVYSNVGLQRQDPAQQHAKYATNVKFDQPNVHYPENRFRTPSVFVPNAIQVPVQTSHCSTFTSFQNEAERIHCRPNRIPRQFIQNDYSVRHAVSIPPCYPAFAHHGKMINPEIWNGPVTTVQLMPTPRGPVTHSVWPRMNKEVIGCNPCLRSSGVMDRSHLRGISNTAVPGGNRTITRAPQTKEKKTVGQLLKEKGQDVDLTINRAKIPYRPSSYFVRLEEYRQSFGQLSHSDVPCEPKQLLKSASEQVKSSCLQHTMKTDSLNQLKTLESGHSHVGNVIPCASEVNITGPFGKPSDTSDGLTKISPYEKDLIGQPKLCRIERVSRDSSPNTVETPSSTVEETGVQYGNELTSPDSPIIIVDSPESSETHSEVADNMAGDSGIACDVEHTISEPVDHVDSVSVCSTSSMPTVVDQLESDNVLREGNMTVPNAPEKVTNDHGTVGTLNSVFPDYPIGVSASRGGLPSIASLAKSLRDSRQTKNNPCSLLAPVQKTALVNYLTNLSPGVPFQSFKDLSGKVNYVPTGLIHVSKGIPAPSNTNPVICPQPDVMSRLPLKPDLLIASLTAREGFMSTAASQETKMATSCHPTTSVRAGVSRPQKPKYFDMVRLQIGAFQYDYQKVSKTSSGKIGKAKLLFGKRKLVYEFALHGLEEFDASVCPQASIEIDLESIVGLAAQGESFLIVEVATPPQMYSLMERKRALDLTGGQLEMIPYHMLQLRLPKVEKLLQYLADFAPCFKTMLTHPVVLRVDPSKRLPKYVHLMDSDVSVPSRAQAKGTKFSKNHCRCLKGCVNSRCGCITHLRKCHQDCRCLQTICTNPFNQTVESGSAEDLLDSSMCLDVESTKMCEFSPNAEEKASKKNLKGSERSCVDERINGMYYSPENLVESSPKEVTVTDCGYKNRLQHVQTYSKKKPPKCKKNICRSLQNLDTENVFEDTFDGKQLSSCDTEPKIPSVISTSKQSKGKSKKTHLNPSSNARGSPDMEIIAGPIRGHHYGSYVMGKTRGVKKIPPSRNKGHCNVKNMDNMTFNDQLNTDFGNQAKPRTGTKRKRAAKDNCGPAAQARKGSHMTMSIVDGQLHLFNSDFAADTIDQELSALPISSMDTSMSFTNFEGACEPYTGPCMTDAAVTDETISLDAIDVVPDSLETPANDFTGEGCGHDPVTEEIYQQPQMASVIFGEVFITSSVMDEGERMDLGEPLFASSPLPNRTASI